MHLVAYFLVSAVIFGTVTEGVASWGRDEPFSVTAAALRGGIFAGVMTAWTAWSARRKARRDADGPEV